MHYFATLLMIYTNCTVPSHSWPRCECVYHKVFLDIMIEASKSYNPASSYLYDVLSLKTEHLLCDRFVDETETANLTELQIVFKQHIRTFIRSQRLNGQPVCSLFKHFMVRMWGVCAKTCTYVCVSLCAYNCVL